MASLRILFDTNVLIPAEPFAAPVDAAAAQLIATIHGHGHQVVVHPANRDDLLEIADPERRRHKVTALAKYPMLEEPPIVEDLLSRAGASEAGSNNERDLRLLAAIHQGAAAYLVTEDKRLRRRAARAGLEPSLVTVAEMLGLLERLHPADASPPPTVDRIASYMLDTREPIFNSIRDGYADFDRWIQKVKADDVGRRCWVVRGPDGRYDAVAIVKVRDEVDLPSPTIATKLCTFKVEPSRAGEKVGELLLGTVLHWAHDRSDVETLFVELKDEQEGLTWFLEQFGFVRADRPLQPNGDATWAKSFRPVDEPALDPLTFHKTYGPPALHPDAPLYVIPIKPAWAAGLFPDAFAVDSAGTTTLGAGTAGTPFGNAIRKAYLCHSKTKAIPPGSTVLFYRSTGSRAASAVIGVGVVESTMRSRSPDRLLSFVGRRTVYSAEDVAALCDRGNREVLAILFRQDRYIRQPWSLSELERQHVLSGPPQSVVRVSDSRGEAWVNSRLAE